MQVVVMTVCGTTGWLCNTGSRFCDGPRTSCIEFRPLIRNLKPILLSIYTWWLQVLTQSAAMALAERLRDELPDVKLMTNHGGGNFKKQFARADKWVPALLWCWVSLEVANAQQ